MADCEVLIIGGGAMGAAAAYQLARRGRTVTLLEKFAPGHEHGSSHGDGRIIRYSYSEPHYVALAAAAYRAWSDLESESGQRLIVSTGGLDLASSETGFLDTLATGLDSRGVDYSRLSGDAFGRRFPQIALPTGSEAIFQADAGVVRADLALDALWQRATEHGATMETHAEVVAIESASAGVRVETRDGRRFEADVAILAAGAWTAALLAPLGPLGSSLELQVTREQLCYVHPRDGVSRADHSAERMPTIIDYHSDQPFYALPQVTPRGTKCGWHRTGPIVDADEPRAIDPSLSSGVQTWIRDRLPGLDPTPRETLTCLYTNTIDQDFVIDRHPQIPQLVIAAGFSGHGFKFVPAVGSLLADLATDSAPALGLDAFRIDRPMPSADAPRPRT